LLGIIITRIVFIMALPPFIIIIQGASYINNNVFIIFYNFLLTVTKPPFHTAKTSINTTKATLHEKLLLSF
ncbi:MAG: hypothetical protein IJP56_00040, partial [Synergistaceae bacterium]|nr:hypothetical protein [Synergistaceae bacterium]